MCYLLKFDSIKLNSILDKYGLNDTWINILATHIKNKSKFLYILENEKFQNHVILESDFIFDLSIGEISVLYEYSLSYVNRENRQKNGQFFTPDDIAELMAKKSTQFEKGVWLDPCSGVGNLSWHLVNIQKDKENFVKNNLILTDIDELALFIARVLFTVSFQERDNNFFNTIKNNFQVFDFLSVFDNNEETLFSENYLSLIPKHDYVIVNPPYLSTNENSKFETAKCADLYAYFLENIIKTSNGFISITPQSFTNAGKFYSLRKLLLTQLKNITIYNFDNVPDTIFHGIKFGSKNTNTANSIRVSIMIALPKVGIHRITSLLRWKTSERQKMLDNLDLFLSNVELTENFFPKVNKMLESLFNKLNKAKIIADIISNRATKFVLYIPSTPRYFIPALKTKVKRSSLKIIYFESEKDLNYAYGLINSSYMYWWWRIRDGGMTLSLETIKSLPLIDYTPTNTIIKILEKSENDNKVYKVNCGNIQENVKHPIKILEELNKEIMPDYYSNLLSVHSNSEFEQLKNI